MENNKLTTSPSLSELESVHNLLKDATVNKLSDRDVMIPITTKAFIEGRLMPTTTSTSSTEMKHDSKEKEQVVVKLGKEYLAEMSLDEACAYIERRMKDLRPMANKDSGTSSTKEKTSFKMKKGFLNNKDSKKSKQKKIEEEEKNLVEDMFPVSSRHNEPILPFMDIFEEYDESGNQVKAEALDVSKQLIDFQRKMKGHSQNDEMKELFDSDNESVAENPLRNTDLVDDMDTNIAVPKKKQSYEEISARLDKLALLEAEEETKKEKNLKSSRKLQGKGWSKGFLSSNNSKTSHSSKKKTDATKVIVPSDAEKVPSNSTINSTTDTHIIQDDRERKVQFSSNNQVKTIPRIGTKSIQTVMGPTRQSQEMQSVLRPQDMEEIAMKNFVMSPSEDTITSNKGTKPVSIGGVVERQNATSAKNNTTLEDTQPKKLSRFAQRRQQMR